MVDANEVLYLFFFSTVKSKNNMTDLFINLFFDYLSYITKIKKKKKTTIK